MNHFYTAGALLGIADTTDAGNDEPAIVAVIGCGGKTTFIESLAREYTHKKVLIAPTTKIKPMNDPDVVSLTTLPECLEHKPIKGIQCLGILNETTGKLESLPAKLLSQLVKHYDIVLMEADGSRGLPCKGWLPNEPVIPRYCTHTVGLVTLNALGKTADESSVLRLPEFLSLTGLQKGDIITLKVLTDMVCAQGGMFHHTAGSRSIFVNQVENSHFAEKAGKWLSEIKKACPGRFACCAYGSARTNKWREESLLCRKH